MSNSPSRTPVRNASHSECENVSIGPCGLREWRISTDSPAKDTSTQLPVPEAVLFRHVSGDNSKLVTWSSDEGRRTPLTGESLAVVWNTAFVSAVLAGEHDRWCDPSSKGGYGQGHADMRLVVPSHPQQGLWGSRHERSGMFASGSSTCRSGTGCRLLNRDSSDQGHVSPVRSIRRQVCAGK